MGIDRVIHIPSDIRTDQSLQPLSIAKILKKIAEKEKIDVAILGKQSIDGDNCQTGPMLAVRNINLISNLFKYRSFDKFII